MTCATYRLHIDPVDLSEEIQLPEPWPTLEGQGFHSDLILRVRGFLLQAERFGFGAPAREFLGRIGDGFQSPFNASEIVVAGDDPDREMKTKALSALQQLADEFGNRVSSIVWQTYAFLATRPDPMAHSTIISAKKHLPFPWWVADTVLHGTGKVYGFKLNLDSVVFAESGMIFEHNCDCSCDIHPAGEEGVIRSILPKSRYQIATGALLSHLLGESLLIMALKMPFEMGLSPEAAEAMSL